MMAYWCQRILQNDNQKIFVPCFLRKIKDTLIASATGFKIDVQDFDTQKEF